MRAPALRHGHGGRSALCQLTRGSSHFLCAQGLRLRLGICEAGCGKAALPAHTIACLLHFPHRFATRTLLLLLLQNPSFWAQATGQVNSTALQPKRCEGGGTLANCFSAACRAGPPHSSLLPQGELTAAACLVSK